MNVSALTQPSPKPETTGDNADGEALSIVMARSTQLAAKSGIGSGPISEREREILTLVVEGCTNQEIASRLSITHGTVRTHLYHIFKKLRVRRRTEAAVKYLIANEAVRKTPGRLQLP